MKKIWIATAAVVATMMTGCGGGSSSPQESVDMPDGMTLILFDNKTSNQMMYDTTKDTGTCMNAAENKYSMTGKQGKLIVWDHETVTGVDQKIVMLHDDFDINEGNLTHQKFHYLGHFHEENNVPIFAAHSADEFDPAKSSDKQKAALMALNRHLHGQKEAREEIGAALPSGEVLCNFYVFGHGHEGDEAPAHIALSKTGKVYVFAEDNVSGELVATQNSFGLDGVTECNEDESNIVKQSEHGVLIFSAQSQKIYLVDSHGMDFHAHSTWDIGRLNDNKFIPTQLVGISGDDDHYAH
jgi:hypothetical protein